MISANRVHVQYLVITIAIMLRISTSQPSIQIVWPTYRIPFLLNATIRFEIDSQNFRLDEEFDLLFGKLNELLSFCCREATLANFSECPRFVLIPRAELFAEGRQISYHMDLVTASSFPVFYSVPVRT